MGCGNGMPWWGGGLPGEGRYPRGDPPITSWGECSGGMPRGEMPGGKCPRPTALNNIFQWPRIFEINFKGVILAEI